MIVGHDWGGLLAWTVATLHPRVVRRLAVLAAPHPRRLRAALDQPDTGFALTAAQVEPDATAGAGATGPVDTGGCA